MSLSLLVAALFLVAPFSSVSAQTQYVVVSPGYINLGMTASVAVTAPASGTYSVIVVSPNGQKAAVNLTFSAAGQKQNATYGVAGSGFNSVASQVGTYNVFVEQNGQVVSSTSFYATNKFVVTMDMVTGGTCALIPGAARGNKLLPRFYISFASNGAPASNATKGISVNFTTPAKTSAKAGWDAGAHLFVGNVSPSWNYTAVGPWNPTATITDAAGNTATFQYAGAPFVISPATLATSVQLADASSGQVITSLSAGENTKVVATITYPKNAEPVAGFVAPLDSATRGGSVTAIVGYGLYNSTAGTFTGSASNPGGVIANVPMTYTGSNGTWTGNFTPASIPALKAGTTYEVAVGSTDKASPPNVGFAILNVAPSVAQTATGTSTGTQTGTSSSATTAETGITLSLALVAAIGTLIAGLVIGMVVRPMRGAKKSDSQV